ncbi:MAG: histone H1 [Rhodobacter sp.]|jgi:hypothetical protein|nr:histone H1 [Rhodobacter sp.]
MPKGPNGEKRPADVIGLAVTVARIATGEIEDAAPDDGKDRAAQALGKKGGAARAASMTPERRAEIAQEAARLRWAAKSKSD